MENQILYVGSSTDLWARLAPAVPSHEMWARIFDPRSDGGLSVSLASVCISVWPVDLFKAELDAQGNAEGWARASIKAMEGLILNVAVDLQGELPWFGRRWPRRDPFDHRSISFRHPPLEFSVNKLMTQQDDLKAKLSGIAGAYLWSSSLYIAERLNEYDYREEVNRPRKRKSLETYD